jgi:hypothetical protein
MKSLSKRILLEAAGNFLCSNNPVKAFDKLQRLSDKSKGDTYAASHVDVWEPFENSTVDHLIELIESQARNMEELVIDALKISKAEKPIEIVIVPSSEDERAYEKVKTTKSAASLSKRRKDSANRFTFNTSAEADAFIKGYTSTTGYLGDGIYFDSRNK